MHFFRCRSGGGVVRADQRRFLGGDGFRSPPASPGEIPSPHASAWGRSGLGRRPVSSARMRLRRSWQLAVFLAVAAGLLAAGTLLPFRAWLDALAAWLAVLGPAGLVLYAAVYAVLTVLMLPVVFMTIAAG